MNFKKAKLLSHKNLVDDVIELQFEPLEPFNFKAGQFVTINIPNEENKLLMRSYSISSAPTQASNTFQLCIKIVEGGLGSHFLSNLEVGSEIEFLGPAGVFTIKKQETPNQPNSLLFIATGTGLSPLKSMIEDELINKRNTQKIHLIFGLRYIKNIFYKEHLEDLKQRFPNFTYTIALSQPEDPSWAENGGYVGRVTNFLNELELDPIKAETYACGLKPMIDETTRILQEKGLPKEAIHFEKFD